MRRLLIFLVGAALTLAFLVLLLPWWLPLAARPIANRFGASFSAYERVGYSRFAVRGVRYERPGVTVSIDRVETDTPVLWAWRHVRGAGSRVVAGEWNVTVSRRTPPPPKRPTGWVPTRATLLRVAATLDQWAPNATAGRGEVRWPAGRVAVDGAAWNRGTLKVRQFVFRNARADVDATFSASRSIEISARATSHPVTLKLRSEDARVSGTASVWEQAAAVEAAFAETGWMPASAALTSDAVDLPGERVRLGASYARLQGPVRLRWSGGSFSLEADVNGVPVSNRAVPPLQIRARAVGDRTAVTVHALDLRIPGTEARLTAPVVVDRSGRIQNDGAVFMLRADLSQLPWGRAEGRVDGEAKVVPGARPQEPRVDFRLAAEGVKAGQLVLAGITSRGHLQWPMLVLDEAVLSGPGSDSVRAVAEVDVKTRRVARASANGTFTPAMLGPLVPKGLRFDRVTFDLHASGPWSTLGHRGRVEVAGLTRAPWRAGQVELTWSGAGAQVDAFDGAFSVPGAQLVASGRVERDALQLTRATWSHDGNAVLSLREPARIAWKPVLEIGPVHLTGADAAVDLRLSRARAGRVESVVRGLRSEWVARWVGIPNVGWVIPSFAIAGAWEGEAPMTYSAAGEVAVSLPEKNTANVHVSLRGNGDGVAVQALRAIENGRPVVTAAGRLPVRLHPGRKPGYSLIEDGALAVDAATVPNAAFWRELATITGIELKAPQLVARVDGTWTKPKGTVTFRADHAAMDPRRFARPLPRVDQIDLALEGDFAGIQLERLGFNIEGQPVRASGRVPVDAGTWAALVRKPVEYLRQRAELRIQVPEAQVAMFSRFLPAALAPAGRLEADLQLNRGSMAGFVRLHDAASRPLGPLGVLQEVNAEVEFSGHRVLLKRVAATSGGQPVVVSGEVELPRRGWFTGVEETPTYDVTVRGTNLPFVRQAGLLLRGDLDLKLRSEAEGRASISGRVNLRDSLFLSDVRAYLPRGATASPSRRPPYFSVETAPLDSWMLNVEVVGLRFMRIRTPVFTGLASARFRLSGTLGEPRAVGDATIDEGHVLMPFASFAVRQGSVRLTEENPYEPGIFLRGQARHYGYDLTMEVTGKASAPNISFTSTPALDPEQVMLMVMTGAAPSNEVNKSLTHRAVQIGAFFGQSLVGSLTGGEARPERLSIESGEKISRQGRETYAIEYKLNDRWSVTGEYDEFDEYNAGFKWRVAPRKKD